MRLAIIATDTVSPVLAAVAGLLGNMEPIYDAFGQIVVNNTIERFDREVEPDGSPWVPSIRVQNEGGKTLQNQGYLKDSIHHQVESDGVFIGTPIPWVVTHQEGRTIRPKNAKALAFSIGGSFVLTQSVTIPKREIFGISSDDETDMTSFLDEIFTGVVQ